MRLFSNGTIYFIDGRTENIKCALASDNVVIVMAGSGTYKICNAPRPSYECLPERLKYTTIYRYSVFKWSDESHVWADYTCLDYVECME